MGRIMLKPLLCLALCLGAGGLLLSAEKPAPPVRYSYEIINTYPHDPAAFTQGFIYLDGFFYESTGLYGHSSLRQVNPEDGTVIKQINLPENYFAEGMTAHHHHTRPRIIQLTWRENRGFVYDLESFTLRETFSYQTEGWGLTYDGEFLIMSDGSPVLTFLDPETFLPVKRITVKARNKPLPNLNELEYIKGKIYANVWLTDYIVIIDPETGLVTGEIDLTGLLDPASQQGHTVDVLNGIAYDEEGDRLFVTGKFWPKIFEIKLLLTESGVN
ncbi:MAG TPA: glutaminyl-peptide cyclotransferase [Bacillota bacterium]